MDLTKCSIKKLSSLLRKKEISATELTDIFLKRIKEKDGNINSYITVNEDMAAEMAKTAQDVIDRNEGNDLAGIPISVKDNICTTEMPTTCASKMLEGFISPFNATVIDKLSNNHTVLLGKTNMDEFAMGSTSQSSYFGGVKNPYNTGFIPGGSSGGAAASVAANLCVAALGTDTGGSVRQPAAFCGVTGLRPTYGSVSRYGLVAFASSLDQIGPIAKSAEDCGILLSAMVGKDSSDNTTANIENNSYTSKIGSSLKGMTIGIPAEFFGEEIDDQIKSIVMEAARQYESMGCTLKSVSLPSFKYAVSAYHIISSAEASSNMARYDGIRFGYRSSNGQTYEELITNTRNEGFGNEVKRRIMFGNYVLSSGNYETYFKKSQLIRAQIKEEFKNIFETCDCIITPTSPSTVYKIGELENHPVKMYSADMCTVPVSIAGLPAINTPCGYDQNGMPVGMSIVGKAFDEATIIMVADAFESNFVRREPAI